MGEQAPTPSEASEQYSKLISQDRLTSLKADRGRMEVGDIQAANTFARMVEHAESLEDVIGAAEMAYASDASIDLEGLKMSITTEYFAKGKEAYKAGQKSALEAREAGISDTMKGALEAQVNSNQAREVVDDYAEQYNAQLVTAALAEAALSGVHINHPEAIDPQKVA